jgi:hypothetical protein
MDPNHNEWEGGYYGQVNEERIPNGVGRWCWHNSTIYEGQWVNGTYSGFGREIYCNGSTYVGEFVKWYREGKGVYTKLKPERI